jgi:sugar phosphate isomerase/epimerase
MKVFLTCLSLLIALVGAGQQKAKVPSIGVVQNIENDSLLYGIGYGSIVESVGKLISPKTVSDAQFKENLHKIKKLRVPLYAFNIFIPGELKVVGPDVDEQAVLSYVEQVFQRARQANVKRIIWGSGGSRRVPESFDHSKAKKQFISIAEKIAESASRYEITLALENLNSTETNFITTIAEALDIVKAVNHPNLRLCVDVYHMLKENESPDIIQSAKGYVIYCEVAEKNGRTPPGVQQENFKPYFAALKKIGYNDRIMIECRWENVREQAGPAFQYLKKQIDEVYANR